MAPNKLDHDILIAHSAGTQGVPQPLEVHLENVAVLASERASKFASSEFGKWLGWWHDAGKVADDVQAYLWDPESKPPGPDHSSAGMIKASEVFEPLAFNIAGHHGGLPDKAGLVERSKRKMKEERVINSLERAKLLFEQKCEKINLHLSLPKFLSQGNEQQQSLAFEFWIRMLHSALVDADCLDTEQHFDSTKANLRGISSSDIDELRNRFSTYYENLTRTRAKNLLNRIRSAVFAACIEASQSEPGVYSLTVPTGGGKTLAAMGFALKHALTHQLDRIIVALPYTSIIDQNAAVYRDIFGEQQVLEHHSAIGSVEKPGDESETERWSRLAAENWDAPIVVTTTIQLLESLFTSRNTRCRKLHNMAQSVIILDEVQTLPPHLLKSTLEVLQHLVDAYKVTILLCTATQPALASRTHFKGLASVREIVSHSSKLFQQLKRVDYDISIDETWTWTVVANEMRRSSQALVVVNTIKDAMAILDEFEENETLFHLSAQMCGAHRKKVLSIVKKRLEQNLPVYLVSTQVIEAGVDIDFPLVLRAVGPLDRIIQAGGRCNREGSLEAGKVVVFIPREGSQPPGAYKRGTDVTESLFREKCDLNLHDPSVSIKYFERFYGASNLDEREIQHKRRYFMFEQTGLAYRLIDDDTYPVIVPYRDGASNIISGKTTEIDSKGRASRDDLRMLQPYLVNLREWALRKCQEENLCKEIVPGLWLWEGKYDEVRGLIKSDPFVVEDLVV